MEVASSQEEGKALWSRYGNDVEGDVRDPAVG